MALAADGAKAPAPKSWNEKMRGLSQVLQELLIDLSSDYRFNDPKRFKQIEKNAGKLAELAHSLKLKEAPAPDSDPTLRFIASEFAKEASLAHGSLKAGNRAYARSVLKSLTGYCVACHTRNGSGPSFWKTGENPALKSLDSVERGNFLASIRQFDEALVEYEKVVAEPGAPINEALNWERAIRAGLAVAVRVKADPDRALGLVEKVLAAPKGPSYLKQQAVQWKKSIEDWKKEFPVKASENAPLPEEVLFSEANRLMNEAKALQRYPADRSADVVYLRASGRLHELMSRFPKSKHSTEALYLSGLSYEVLQDLGLWDLHEFYYLACIIKEPHTPKARQCFNHYEQSVYLGYTGSAGSDIPGEVREKLDRLDLLSSPLEPKAASPKPLQ